MPKPGQRPPSQRVSKSERDTAKKNFSQSKAEQRAAMARKKELLKAWKMAKPRFAQAEKIAKALSKVEKLEHFDKLLATLLEELGPVFDKKNKLNFLIPAKYAELADKELQDELKRRELEVKRIGQALRGAQKNLKHLMTHTEVPAGSSGMPAIPAHTYGNVSFLATFVIALLALYKMRNR